MRRILVFELNWLGDILFSVPLLRAIKRALPDSCVACAVVPRYEDLLKRNPYVDDLINFSDRRGPLSIIEKIIFTGKIKREKFDTCFLLKPSVTKTQMAALAGIPRRIGFYGKNASLTDYVKMPQGEVHRVDQLLALADAAGIPRAGIEYEYFVTSEDEAKAGEIIRKFNPEGKKILVINPGGNWSAKRWPSQNFVELAREVLSRSSDVKIFVAGSRKDLDLARQIVKDVNDERCVDVSGLTGLGALAALFKKSRVVVSGDSGPLHLASSVGAKTVALFGPTSRGITGPRGKGETIVIQHDVGCEIPCYVTDCYKGYECMCSIYVSEVLDAVEKFLARGERGANHG